MNFYPSFLVLETRQTQAELAEKLNRECDLMQLELNQLKNKRTETDVRASSSSRLLPLTFFIFLAHDDSRTFDPHGATDCEYYHSSE